MYCYKCTCIVTSVIVLFQVYLYCFRCICTVSGVVGDWRNYLSTDMIDLIDTEMLKVNIDRQLVDLIDYDE